MLGCRQQCVQLHKAACTGLVPRQDTRRSTAVQRNTLCHISQQLVQLEKAVLADMPTAEIVLLLKKFGVEVRDSSTLQQQQQQQVQEQLVQRQHQDLSMGQHSGAQQQLQQQPDSVQPLTETPPQQSASTADVQVEELKQQRKGTRKASSKVRTGLQPGSTAATRQQQPANSQQQQMQQLTASRAAAVSMLHAQRSALLARLAAARVAACARIVRLPLRLTVTGQAGSRQYLTVPVDVEGVGFVDFLLDGSLYLSRITPTLRNKLGMGSADGIAVISGRNPTHPTATSAAAKAPGADSGISGSESSKGSGINSSSNSSSGSSSVASNKCIRLRQRVQLPTMWLGTAQLPPQQAYVTPLSLPPRQRLSSSDSAGSSNSSSSPPRVQPTWRTPGVTAVGGLLGAQVLRSFQVDVDIACNQLALHPVGHVELGLCDVMGMKAVPCRFTRSGAIVLPVSIAGSPPFTGLLDLSATTSILNWEAAALLGMQCREIKRQHQQQSQRQQHIQQQQHTQPQQPADDTKEQGISSSSISSMYGYFGSIEVVPDNEVLQRPRLPSQGGSSSSNNAHVVRSQRQQRPWIGQVRPLAALLDNSGSNTAGSSSVGGSSSNSGKQYSPLRVQKHQVVASKIKMVLGHPHLAASASSKPSGGGSSSDSETASLALEPPLQFGVAGLRGLGHSGLAGQPVMVVGADVWARQRAVLCLKAGKLYLSGRH